MHWCYADIHVQVNIHTAEIVVDMSDLVQTFSKTNNIISRREQAVSEVDGCHLPVLIFQQGVFSNYLRGLHVLIKTIVESIYDISYWLMLFALLIGSLLINNLYV